MSSVDRRRSRSRSPDRSTSRHDSKYDDKKGLRDEWRDVDRERRHRRSRSRSRTRSRSRDRDRRRNRDDSNRSSKTDERPKPPRRLQPNQGILGSLLRQHVRTNDRMDKEEVERATEKLKVVDPRTNRTARLMSEHLSSVEVPESEPRSTVTITEADARVAALRHAATHGSVRLEGLPPSYLAPSNSSKGDEDWRRKRSVSPDREVLCPYNKSHRLPQSSLKNHLTKCPDAPK